MDCIFCKIINKEIPNYTVYEDENTLAFLDIHPHAKGHTVVVPKKHAEKVSDLEDDQIAGLFQAVKKTMARIESALSPDGYNVGWNDRPAAGQVVPHLHVHIMPRWQGDGGGSMHSIVKAPGNTPVAEIAALFNH